MQQGNSVIPDPDLDLIILLNTKPDRLKRLAELESNNTSLMLRMGLSL